MLLDLFLVVVPRAEKSLPVEKRPDRRLDTYEPILIRELPMLRLVIGSVSQFLSSVTPSSCLAGPPVKSPVSKESADHGPNSFLFLFGPMFPDSRNRDFYRINLQS